MADEKTEDGKTGDDDPGLAPLKAVEEHREARHAAERKTAELEGYIKGAAAQPAAAPDPAPRDLTAAELRQAVADEKMSEAQADDIRDRQSERRTDARIDERVDAKADALVADRAISDELARYQTAIPGLTDKESPEFEKVQREFDYLVQSSGYDAKDLRTQATAVRMAFGDVAKLEKVGQALPRETHQETGGGREPGLDGAARTDGWPKDMPAKNRRYYDGLIAKGVMTGRKAALAEWNYKSPRHAA